MIIVKREAQTNQPHIYRKINIICQLSSCIIIQSNPNIYRKKQ